MAFSRTIKSIKRIDGCVGRVPHRSRAVVKSRVRSNRTTLSPPWRLISVQKKRCSQNFPNDLHPNLDWRYGTKEIDRIKDGWWRGVHYHWNAPMFRRLGDGIGDRSTGSAENHDFARVLVHHVEKGLHSNRCAALQIININKRQVKKNR